MTRGAKRKQVPRTRSAAAATSGTAPLSSDRAGKRSSAVAITPNKTAGKRAKTAATITAPAQTSEDDDDDEVEAGTKRARGRPRLDIEDVTAADRRRTQIRLAQRAYRSRKEKAISSLECTVQSLHESNEAMSGAFMALHDFVERQGLLDAHPGLTQQLRQTTAVFLERARRTRCKGERNNGMGSNNDDESDHMDGGVGNGLDAASFALKQSRIADAVTTFGYQVRDSSSSADDGLVAPTGLPTTKPGNHSNVLFGGMLLQPPLSETVTTSSLPSLGQESLCRNNSSNSNTSGRSSSSSSSSSSLSNTAYPSVSAPPPTDSDINDPFAVDLFATYPFSLASPPESAELVPASVPSIAVTTAAAATATTAFPNNPMFVTAAAGDPYASLPPPGYSSLATWAMAGVASSSPTASGYSFGLRVRHNATARAYMLISNPNPPAEVFARAFGFCIVIHSVSQIRTRLRARLEGPPVMSPFTQWHLPFVHRANPQMSRQAFDGKGGGEQGGNNNTRRVLPSVHVSLPGLKGEFFDCDEAEMYLRQRGVAIPPGASRVVVTVDDADFKVEDASGGSDGQLASEGGNPPMDWRTPDYAPPNPADHTPLMSSLTGGVGNGILLGPLPPPPQSQPVQAVSRRRVLSLDVDVLVNELARRGTCLGETPGFRVSDVNEAFWSAVHKSATGL
ncbi:bZIP family transcription factor [Niveomyces insectorum RCEF 264]|uniref:BZIP family transcription factor n=1 Tax=Niveomyces insectorum RCEF 264 TaxID=1081102 RepID=A0A167SSH9_9HYPO|nr:bZIP family transcription factor [Niveomyces insectorum RCEF 264]